MARSASANSESPLHLFGRVDPQGWNRAYRRTDYDPIRSVADPSTDWRLVYAKSSGDPCCRDSFFLRHGAAHRDGKRWADLHDAKCHLGAYAAYSGEAVPTAFGQSITPKYVLKVGKRELPVAASAPDSRGATVGTDVQARHILWVRHAADVKTDTADEIARVMADLDSFAHLFEAPAGGAAAPTSGEGSVAAWGPP